MTAVPGPPWAAATVGAPGGGEGAAAPAEGRVRTGHPAVDVALQAMENAAGLPPADQIAQFEATHRILSETLATIDEG